MQPNPTSMKQAIRWLFSINWNFSHNVPFSIPPEGSSNFALIKNNLANPSHKSGRLVHSASLYHFFFRTSRITFFVEYIAVAYNWVYHTYKVQFQTLKYNLRIGTFVKRRSKKEIMLNNKSSLCPGKRQEGISKGVKDGSVFYESQSVIITRIRILKKFTRIRIRILFG